MLRDMSKLKIMTNVKNNDYNAECRNGVLITDGVA